MTARELVGFLGLVLAAGCSDPDTVPRWEPTVCRFALPAGQVEGQTVDCGDLIVAENRERPESATVKLHVQAILAATGARNRTEAVSRLKQAD